MQKVKPDFCSWQTNRSLVTVPKVWCQNFDACGKTSTLVLIIQRDPKIVNNKLLLTQMLIDRLKMRIN